MDALHLPTPAVESASADTTNLALLLALAAEDKSSHIDETAFAPTRRLRRSQRHLASRAAAVATTTTTYPIELKTVQILPDESNAHGGMTFDLPPSCCHDFR